MRAAAAAGAATFLFTAAATGVFLLTLDRRAERAVTALEAAANAGHSAAEALTIERTPSRMTIQLDHGVTPHSLAAGWSVSEPGLGVWSVGHHAVLKLQDTPAAASFDLAVTLQPFLAAGLPAQRVVVHAAGRELADWTLTGSGFRTLHLTLPAQARTADGAIELSLDLPDADSPARRTPGSKDGRMLAVSLKSVELSS